MKKLSFPTAHTVLLLIAAFVAALTWLIPAGKYDTLEYQADQKVFIHHAQDGDKTYPGTQKTLDSLKMKIDIEKFESGAIWKAVGIPNTYHELEPNPQGLTAFIQSPFKGITQAIDVILFVLIIKYC